ncbi:head completion/stabilization protein [Escherichia coli]|uniref:head completion/stabilization protein n=2 Tax=Escherichia coli TaxID=562 RepID=UPI002FCCD362
MFDGKSIHYQQAIIQNDGFWPDIDAGDFEKSRSIPAVTSHETVLTALLCAVTEINTELAARREYWQEQGHTGPFDIPGSTPVLHLPEHRHQTQYGTQQPEQNADARKHITATDTLTNGCVARAESCNLCRNLQRGRREALGHHQKTAEKRPDTLPAEAAMAVRARGVADRVHPSPLMIKEQWYDATAA